MRAGGGTALAPAGTERIEGPEPGRIVRTQVEIRRAAGDQLGQGLAHPAGQGHPRPGLGVVDGQGPPGTEPERQVTSAEGPGQETGLATERPRVAAVFVNRLAKGIRLESDPTIVYGITGGKPLGHAIRQSEITTQTPYNTYLIAGLPPGPIDNPGRASLAAVLDPPHTDELYFVANGTGGHSFASTLAEHQKNVEHWRAIEHDTGPPAPAKAGG